MKNSSYNPKDLEIDITLVVDGEADDRTAARVERAAAEHPELRRDIERTVRMHTLLRNRSALPEQPFLRERIIHRTVEARAERRAPRHDHGLRPVAGALLTVLILALAVVGYVNRTPILRFITSKQTAVQTAYEESVLKGWLMPLFGKTSKDDVLQYAMFGTLPFGQSDGTVLRLDENAKDGYRVEFARDTAQKRSGSSVADLYREIRPTASQRRMFDSLFHYAGRQLESTVLLDQNNQIAIDPSITRFNRVILSSIAAGLDPAQRRRFGRFLEARNTTYALASAAQASRPLPPEVVIRSVQEIPRSGTFFLIGIDTMSYTVLDIDMDSLRDRMEGLRDRQRVMARQMQRLAEVRSVPSKRSYAMRIPDRNDGRVLSTTYSSGNQTISLSFDGEIEELAVDMQKMQESFMRDFVVIRREIERSAGGGAQHGSVRIDRDIRVHIRPDSGEMRMYFTPDSGMQMELRIHQQLERGIENMLQHDLTPEQFQTLPGFRRQGTRQAPEDGRSIRENDPAIIDSIVRHHLRSLNLLKGDSAIYRRPPTVPAEPSRPPLPPPELPAAPGTKR